MQNNRIYYGEYSLKHWIDLLLRKNITLPGYQRSFVWSPEKVIHFLESIYNESFIPPVVIGAIHKNEKRINIIIDGQQRLTSLLLGYLSVYPNKGLFRTKDDSRFADDNDDYEDDVRDILGWTFEYLLDEDSSNSKESILKRIKDEKKYDELTSSIIVDDEFLETHYLGFSYLVPSDKNSQLFFSNTFKSINTLGTSLSAMEARRSLYYLSDGMENFFDPACCRKILVENGFKADRIDFVRYLSFSFQNLKNPYGGDIARNYGRALEDYYSDFILSVVNNKEDVKFAVCDNSNVVRIKELGKALSDLGIIEYKFVSIIDADVRLYGLIYYLVAEKREINLKNIGLLNSRIENKVQEFKKDDKHRKNPAALKHLRMRLEASKLIYQEFFENEQA